VVVVEREIQVYPSYEVEEVCLPSYEVVVLHKVVEDIQHIVQVILLYIIQYMFSFILSPPPITQFYLLQLHRMLV
jgi:hypothetical protein